jgi:hypothetical protein
MIESIDATIAPTMAQNQTADALSADPDASRDRHIRRQGAASHHASIRHRPASSPNSKVATSPKMLDFCSQSRQYCEN